METLAACISELRAFYAVDQAEVARETGLSQATISRWERGKTQQPGLKQVRRLADSYPEMHDRVMRAAGYPAGDPDEFVDSEPAVATLDDLLDADAEVLTEDRPFVERVFHHVHVSGRVTVLRAYVEQDARIDKDARADIFAILDGRRLPVRRSRRFGRDR